MLLSQNMGGNKCIPFHSICSICWVSIAVVVRASLCGEFEIEIWDCLEHGWAQIALRGGCWSLSLRCLSFPRFFSLSAKVPGPSEGESRHFGHHGIDGCPEEDFDKDMREASQGSFHFGLVHFELPCEVCWVPVSESPGLVWSEPHVEVTSNDPWGVGSHVENMKYWKFGGSHWVWIV